MYSASKHAVLGFARSVAACVKNRNIRVNVIHPFFCSKSFYRSLAPDSGTLKSAQRLAYWV